ncbi:hypothetical protein D6833_05130 [Candidatus Parcubacteria bacterium]|nr:MAG: hypothetical protein D6833_05130 [Candidatus Parcubacteria bacterium]
MASVRLQRARGGLLARMLRRLCPLCPPVDVSDNWRMPEWTGSDWPWKEIPAFFLLSLPQKQEKAGMTR